MLTGMRLLAEETALREGPTPDALEHPLLVTPLFAIAADAFLLSLPNGLRFHYRKKAGVVCSRSAGISDAEVELFHQGSVYGAVAWLNGLVPLHASAVTHEGRLHAFTGPSGAGKSTLCAALAQRGLPVFADDVLVLDLSDPARPVGLPGHKRLKLWDDALEMTDLDRGQAVRDGLAKYFVAPPLSDLSAPLPLASLTFLDPPSGREASLTDCHGAQRLNRMLSAFYRPRYIEALQPAVERFALAMRLVHQLPTRIFDRPRDRDRFDGNVDVMAAAIRAAGG